MRTPGKRLVRRADVLFQVLVNLNALDHPHQDVLSIQAKNQDVPTVHNIVITVQKPCSSLEPGVVPPLETTLKAMYETSPTDCPNYRFKEWTLHEKSGLELAAIIPPLPPMMVFGNVYSEDTNIAMVRCFTAHQLGEQYGVTSPPGDLYHSTAGWWLLVTSLDETSLVSPGTLLFFLENLRTIEEFDNTLCFHLPDIFRGKFHIQHWLQLLAITLCRQAKYAYKTNNHIL